MFFLLLWNLDMSNQEKGQNPNFVGEICDM